MIFLSVEDFFEKADACRKPERQEELEYARKMKAGDEEARERLVEGYLPQVAGYIRASRKEQLGMVLYCARALERAVDSFDFFQDSETFVHRLSWALRQAGTAYSVR